MKSSRPNRPIRFPRGDSYVHEVRLVDGSGAPIDISTNRTYTAQIRNKPDDTSPAATFSCAITDGAAGKVLLSLTAETTAAMTPGNYVYDLVETNTATSHVITLMRGTVTVEHDVTR